MWPNKWQKLKQQNMAFIDISASVKQNHSYEAKPPQKHEPTCPASLISVSAKHQNKDFPRIHMGNGLRKLRMKTCTHKMMRHFFCDQVRTRASVCHKPSANASMENMDKGAKWMQQYGHYLWVHNHERVSEWEVRSQTGLPLCHCHCATSPAGWERPTSAQKHL